MAYRDPKAALRALTGIAASQGGYFTARQAESAGYGPTHVSYHRSAGNIERVGHGLYRMQAMPPGDHDDLVRLWLWSRDRDDRPQAVFSHQTALVLHELAEFIPRAIHLTVPPGFRKRAPEGCVLYKSSLDARRTQPIGPVPVTSPLQTLEDLSDDASLPTEQFDRAVAAAADRGLVGAADAKRQQQDVSERLTAPPRTWTREFPVMATESGLATTDLAEAFEILEAFWDRVASRRRRSDDTR